MSAGRGQDDRPASMATSGGHDPAPRPEDAHFWNADLYQSSHEFVWQLADDLLQLLAPGPGERILDLGCGTGQLTSKIAERGAEVLGIDRSPEMIEQARRNFPGLKFESGNATALTVEAPFDAVFSNATLHWVKPPEAAAARIWAALRPGGRFVAEFGGWGNVARVRQALRHALLEVARLDLDGLDPWYFPSVGEYAALLERQGFEVRLATLFDRPTPLEGGDDGQRDWLRMFGASLLERVDVARRGDQRRVRPRPPRPLPRRPLDRRLPPAPGSRVQAGMTGAASAAAFAAYRRRPFLHPLVGNKALKAQGNRRMSAGSRPHVDFRVRRATIVLDQARSGLLFRGGLNSSQTWATGECPPSAPWGARAGIGGRVGTNTPGNWEPGTMEYPSLELLSGRAYPELAGALRGGIEPIIARWQEVVRRALPSADELTFAQLRDDMPKVLEHVAVALESDEPLAAFKLQALAPEHGAARFHQQFRLEELLIEHTIIRPIMLDEVTARLGRPMSVVEVSALMVGLDLMTRQNALSFVEHQTRQLKAANEAQSKYLSFLSHDLRGGLNGVCLMIEVLRRELSKEERFQESVEDLDMMRRSIFETIGTMDRFLHAERFRKGKVQVRPMRVNLKSLLAELSAHFAYMAKDKSVQLKFDAPTDSDLVSDKDLLTIILQNVTSNAIKYGSRAPVELTARRVGNGDWRVSVADKGPGIPPEKMKDLFGPFTRGDTQGQPGVGLGLSIARQAADLLGARLWAESPSDNGKGTTFHLDLAPVKMPG